MNRTNNKVYIALLYWIKINSLFASKNKIELTRNLKKIEEYLSTLKVSEVTLLHTSKEYYTISYKECDKNKIYQFTINEVNSKIDPPVELDTKK